MRRSDAIRWTVTALGAVLALGPLSLPAQTTTSLSVLHTFTATSGEPPTNDDGAHPAAGLVLSGNALFGTTTNGGSAGYGTVFQINTDGSGFETLYNFTNGSDGAYPMAPLLVAGGMLYGTASAGGSFNYGTIFTLGTQGSNYSTLYAFTNGEDGALPAAGLLLSGGVLYGTTAGTLSGSSYGTVFMINTNGSSFFPIHQFSKPLSSAETNADGFLPTGPLVVAEDALYGVTHLGGKHGTGTLFSAASDGSSFVTLYPFAAASFPFVNGGGAYPQGGLVVSGSDLFGAAFYGGTGGGGTAYEILTSGDGFLPLCEFNFGDENSNPQGPLLLSTNLLYGTTPAAIFSLTTNGQDFTNLISFPLTTENESGIFTNSTGFDPNGGLVLAGQSFYGTAQDGGTNGSGTIFAFNLFPASAPLKIQVTASAAVLTWANSAFALQSAPSLSGVFTNVPGATSPSTNVLTGSQMYFRLLYPN